VEREAASIELQPAKRQVYYGGNTGPAQGNILPFFPGASG
jgi:hypothetical protein